MDLGFLFGARRKNLIGASVHFARHTLPVAIRPARILWHQVIGFLFLVLAVAPARFEYKALQNFKGDGESWTRVVLSGIFYRRHDGIRHLLFPARSAKSRGYDRHGAPWRIPLLTRGIYPDMYRSRVWTMRQYAGFGSSRKKATAAINT